MNIVIIGNGMYATGRGTDAYGTILPAVFEWKRFGSTIEKLVIVGTNGKHSSQAKKKVKELSSKTGIFIETEVYPKEGDVNRNAYKEVIRAIEKPACAIVVVPDHLHYQVVSDCLKAGLHVLVVKPLTPTVEEGRKLIDLANANNLYCGVEFHKRYDRSNMMMRDTYQSGAIGIPLYLIVEYSQRKSIPTKMFQEWVHKTNILQYLGIHYIDIVRFVTRAVPVRVMALGQKTWLQDHEIDSYDSIQCIVEWETSEGDKFTQTLLTNWIDPETTSSMSDQKIKIIGTKGRYEADQKERGIRLCVDDSYLQQPNPDFCMSYKDQNGNSNWKGYGIDSIVDYLNRVTDFVENDMNINNIDNSSRSSFEESLISTSVLESANKSLNLDGDWVVVDNR